MTTRLVHLRERLGHPASITADDDPALLWAAVAIIIAPEPESVLLIRRAERAGDPWSGHVALPGGRREAGDPDLLTTAVRETREEVGIRLASSDLAGTLQDVVPRTPTLPPIAVRPYVFVLSHRPPISLNLEVTASTWVAISHLLHPGTHHTVRLEVAGQSRQVAAYELADGIVWGMTERILTNLVSLF